MIHPKIGPEASVRQRYRKWKQYKICHFGRDYTFTCNARGLIVICHSKFRFFKNKNIEKLIDYCKSKEKELVKIADEEKEMWHL